MKLLQLINTNSDWINHLWTEHGIKHKIDPEFPNLVNLCYDQIASKKLDEYALECRGVVVDTKTNTIAARPFDRFFNYGEAASINDRINLDNCSVDDKLDGSLINFYYSKSHNRWMVSTKGTPTARNALTKDVDGNVVPFLHLIAEYFGYKVEHYVDDYYVPPRQEYMSYHDYNSIMRKIGEILEEELDKDYTYITELVSPINRIVTEYVTTDMFLLGIRHNESGEYVRGNVSLFSTPKSYNCSGINEIKEALNNINKNSDTIHEGFVVTCNDTGIKAKFKNTAYLTIHRNLGKDTLNDKAIIEVVANGEESEIVSYFPNLSDRLDELTEKRERVIENIQYGFEMVNTIDDRKMLAMELKKYGIASIIFPSIKKEVYNPLLAWSNASLKIKMELLQ